MREPDFLLLPNRMNVATTRHERQQIIVGSSMIDGIVLHHCAHPDTLIVSVDQYLKEPDSVHNSLLKVDTPLPSLRAPLDPATLPDRQYSSSI